MFELSSDHEDFRRLVRDFAEAEIAPHVEEWDRDSHFPVHLIPKMGELGLFGLEAPEEFGGAGMGHEGFSYLCVAIEELGRVDQAMGITLEAGVGLGINPIQTYGSQEQKERWLPDLLAGKALAGFGLTEPEAGSDAGATRTRAVLEDGEWVVNGAKAFITNSGTDITSLVTVTAVTGERDNGKKEISTIIVPADTPGFTAEPAYNKVGWNASDTHPLSFDDARVPRENLLGERGRGYANFLSILDEGRIAIAGLATGAAQGCVDESIKYAKERKSFGKPIAEFQSVSFAIARMEARAHVARMAYYDAAAKMLAGKPFKKEAAIAKMISSEAAMDNARMATQIHGGYGFMNEYPVARHYRDSKILEIGEGTTEVQLMLIARGLGL